MGIHPLAGKPVPANMLINIPELISAYYIKKPDMNIQTQRVSFGTSGHRGSSLETGFNEDHILAISQAVCEYRMEADIKGTLFLGIDTHPLSWPARLTALQVLAANNVDVRIAKDYGFTPTPVISHAILANNRNGMKCDGIVVTPSHNPPSDGGFKYNPPHGGPADVEVTSWIENRANELLKNGLSGIQRLSVSEALNAPNVQQYDFITPYVDDLENVVDMKVIAASGIHIGADALGGAGLAYYTAIKERYDLNMDLLHGHPDFTFSFMHLDHDGKIRMDCSSPYAMAGLVSMKDRYDIAFGNDTDFDRHGIITRTGGLMNPNHYLAVAIDYLCRNRKKWGTKADIGKTVVSSSIIDRITAGLGRKVIEVPVGFKWFVDGLLSGNICFGGEESAGASFLRMDGSVWTTDKDGIIMTLLSAEITAKTGKDPHEYYNYLTEHYGNPVYERIDTPATIEQKKVLGQLSPEKIVKDTLAGEPVRATITSAPGNGAPIGGVKIVAENGWFALRPSGTENIYKIYAESFKGKEHLELIQQEARAIADMAV